MGKQTFLTEEDKLLNVVSFIYWLEFDLLYDFNKSNTSVMKDGNQISDFAVSDYMWLDYIWNLNNFVVSEEWYCMLTENRTEHRSAWPQTEHTEQRVYKVNCTTLEDKTK